MSLSLNIEGWLPQILSMASTIANNLFGAYAIPIGIGLGIGILGLIAGAFSKVIKL